MRILSALIISFLLLRFVTPADTAWYFNGDAQTSVLQFSSNAYYSLPQALSPYFNYFNLALLVYLLLRQLKTSAFQGILAALPLVLVVCWCFGLDTALISSLLVALCLREFLFSEGGEVKTEHSNFFLLGFSLLLILFSSQLAFFVLLCVFITERLSWQKYWPLLLCPFIFTLFSRSPVFPDYPTGARVVPFYGTMDGLRPLSGDEPAVLSINREYLRVAFLKPTIVLLLSVLLLSVLRKRLFLLPLLFCLVLLGDTAVLPADLSQLAPLQSLSRLISSYCFLPLIYPLFGYVLLLFWLEVLKANQRREWLLLLLSFAALALTPVFKPQHARLWQESIPQATGEALSKLRSPSYFILNSYGPELSNASATLREARFLPLANFNPVLSSSQQQNLLPQAIDGRPETRWSTGLGQQTGEEWVYIRFEQPISLLGLRFRSARFSTDYPRRLSYEYSPACSTEFSAAQPYRPGFSPLSDQGELLFTAKGYPYFAGQDDTLLLFLADSPVQCVKVRQTGHTPSFDWSISEIELSLKDK